MTRYLDLADYLLIAEGALQVRAEDLYMQVNLPLAESALGAPRAAFGEVEFYPEFVQKVAVLGHRLVANHPLPDGNKRTALLCMMEFAARNDCTWVAPETDGPEGDETVEVMVAVAAGDLPLDNFVAWVRARIGST
ncbi:MAG: Fic family protein [Egibacteraceae bacterium]